eukprot:g47217.t1
MQSLNNTNQAVVQLQLQMTNAATTNPSNVLNGGVNQIGNNMSQSGMQTNRQVPFLQSFGTGNQTNLVRFQMNQMVEAQKMQRLHAQQRRAAYAQMAGYSMPGKKQGKGLLVGCFPYLRANHNQNYYSLYASFLSTLPFSRTYATNKRSDNALYKRFFNLNDISPHLL